MGWELERLCMTCHCPTGHDDDDGGDNIALRFAFSWGKEYSENSSAEPNDTWISYVGVEYTHGSMLKILVRPIWPPSMFCKRIDQSKSEQKRVKYPQAAITALSKNSWLLFRLSSHACPNNNIIDITAPYAIKLLPIIPWARHYNQYFSGTQVPVQDGQHDRIQVKWFPQSPFVPSWQLELFCQ